MMIPDSSGVSPKEPLRGKIKEASVGEYQVEPLAPSKIQIPGTASREVKVECAHSHPIHDLTAIRLGFPKAEELIQSALKGPRIRQERALAMAYHLDAYIENKMPHELHHAIEKAISKAQKASATPLKHQEAKGTHYRESCGADPQKSRRFFALFCDSGIPRKGPFTPIETC